LAHNLLRGKRTHLATKAVSNSTDAFDTNLLSEVLDACLNNGVDNRGLVGRKPCGKIGLSALHVAELDWVAVEKIGDDSQVSVLGIFVGKELGVDVDTEDVAQNNDGLFWALVAFGVDDVGLGWNLVGC
jgi:hypothetical protein